MVKFSYTAKQGPQKTLEGTVEAENLDLAIKKVLQSGYTPIDVREQESRPEQADKTQDGQVNVALVRPAEHQQYIRCR